MFRMERIQSLATGKWIAVLASLFVLALFVPSGATAAPPRKLAVLIGIDDYQVVNDLRGAVNDVRLMRELLVGSYGFAGDDVLMLENKQATHAAIVGAIRSALIAKATAGDVVVIHFSGHGSQMRDAVGGDEIDGWDETLVAYDSRTPGIFDVSDDEVNELLIELAQKTENITVILDSCHSGSATRVAGTTIRGIERDTRTPPGMAPQPPAAAARDVSDDGTDFRRRGTNYVLISGSRPEELSNETLLGGQPQGALTYFLVGSLRAASARATYQDVMSGVREEVSSRFPSQHPTLEGPGLNTVAFGTERIVRHPSVVVTPDGAGRVAIAGGTTVGLSPGAQLAVFPIDPAAGAGATEAAAIADVIVDRAAPFSSSGRITRGAVAARSRGEMTHSVFGTFRANVWFEPGGAPPAMTALRTKLQLTEQVQEVIEERSAILRAVRRNGAWELQSPDEVLLSPPVPVGSADEVPRFANQIATWARWHAVRELKNPAAALDVRLDLKRAEDATYSVPPSELSSGAKLTMKVTNRSEDPLHLALIDLSSSGRVTVLYPTVTGAEEKLPAGQSVEITRVVGVPDGFDFVTDTVKVIASTQPVDATVYAQDPARAAREVSSMPIDDWVTQQQAVRVRRPSTRSTGIALLFNQPITDDAVTRSLTDAARAVCPEGNEAAVDGCVRVSPLSNDRTVVEVQTALSRSDVRAGTSAARAFDEAYELRDLSGARRAEPLLDVPMPSGPNESGFGTRAGGAETHDPLTDDDRWSLKYVAAAQAQKSVRDALGRPEGQEAKGVRVAHPDTGFTEHPETRPAVLAEAGHDYVTPDDDATDPLIDDGPLANPGHGTASGSVIVSPSGRQLSGTGKAVYGIATGAELVPLRVNTSVVVFSTKSLAKAIEDAADDKLGAKVSVISIAMGGPPSWTLWHAVKEARKKGVLLISAAGNYVGIVVWPARFDDAIAVAAIGARCEPWTFSSRGSAVDISAPGESVWRALVTKSGQFDVGRGSGTTFATGTTAGVTALWVARYEGTAEFQSLKSSGGLTAAYRKILQSTSWRPNDAGDPSGGACKNAVWRPRLYGAGIVNADRLLSTAPVSDGSRSVEADRGLEQLPLFSTLYPPDTAYSVVEAGYLRIFGGPAQAFIEKTAIFENEILYHYTLNRDLEVALDTLVADEGAPDAAARVATLLRGADISGRLRAALH
jgi:hypothetical protein